MSVYSVNVYPSSTTIETGKWYYDAYAIVNASSNCCADVEWYSDNTNVATVGLSSGYIFGRSPGVAKIYARSIVDASKNDYITVTVTNDTIFVESVSLSLSSISLNIGEEIILDVMLSPSNATNKSLSWRSANESVATVSEGLVTAKSTGQTDIYAEAIDGSCKYDICHVTVTEDILVSSVTVVPARKTLSIGESVFLSVAISPTNATNKFVNWSSNNTDVVTINPDSGLIYAIGAGVATVTAISQDGSNKRGTCTILVESQTYNVSNIKVYQSSRMPGKKEDGSIADDMKNHNKSKGELLLMSDIDGKHHIVKLAEEYDKDPNQVINKLYGLAQICCADDDYMYLVASNMIEHFISGTASDFRDGILNLKAFGHESTRSFVNKSKELIIDYLSKNKGNIYSMANSIAFSTEISNEVQRPVFDKKFDDYLNGLLFCVHDTWGYFIEIKNYSCDGFTFSGTIKYTIYDHFGLDDNDITGDKSYLNGDIECIDHFAAWYVLQHYEGCNKKHKPFVTFMEKEFQFEGYIC